MFPILGNLYDKSVYFKRSWTRGIRLNLAKLKPTINISLIQKEMQESNNAIEYESLKMGLSVAIHLV